MNTIVFQDGRIMNNFSFSPSNIITVTIDYPCNKKCNTSLEPTFPMATKPLTIHQRHVCLQLLPSLLVRQNRKHCFLRALHPLRASVCKYESRTPSGISHSEGFFQFVVDTSYWERHTNVTRKWTTGGVAGTMNANRKPRLILSSGINLQV